MALFWGNFEKGALSKLSPGIEKNGPKSLSTLHPSQHPREAFSTRVGTSQPLFHTRGHDNVHQSYLWWVVQVFDIAKYSRKYYLSVEAAPVWMWRHLVVCRCQAHRGDATRHAIQYSPTRCTTMSCRPVKFTAHYMWTFLMTWKLSIQ